MKKWRRRRIKKIIAREQQRHKIPSLSQLSAEFYLNQDDETLRKFNNSWNSFGAKRATMWRCSSCKSVYPKLHTKKNWKEGKLLRYTCPSCNVACADVTA